MYYDIRVAVDVHNMFVHVSGEGVSSASSSLRGFGASTFTYDIGVTLVLNWLLYNLTFSLVIK